MQAVYSQLVTAYREAEKYLLERILAADLTNWERARANQQLALIQAKLTELGQATYDWEVLHLPRLYAAGVNAADAGLAGIPNIAPPPDAFAALHTASIEIIGEQLAVGLDAAIQVVGRTVNDAFRQSALSAIQQGTALGERRRDVTRRMIKDLTDRGVTAFRDVQGRKWTLGNYAEMSVRTTTREATNTATENRIVERGHDLVQIPRHDSECPKCVAALAGGTIFSISGQSSEYPALSDAEAAGLFHPNCLHVVTPYNPYAAAAA